MSREGRNRDDERAHHDRIAVWAAAESSPFMPIDAVSVALHAMYPCSEKLEAAAVFVRKISQLATRNAPQAEWRLENTVDAFIDIATGDDEENLLQIIHLCYIISSISK